MNMLKYMTGEVYSEPLLETGARWVTKSLVKAFHGKASLQVEDRLFFFLIICETLKNEPTF